MTSANQPPSSLPPQGPSGADDDLALMAAIAEGDRAAFARFYDRFSAPVFAYCLRALRDRGEAEDLLLDVFAEIWERAGRYDPKLSRPFTYLMNLTRARMIDRLRSRGARQRRMEPGGQQPAGRRSSLDDVQVSGANPLGDSVLAEQRSRVLRAMESLTADQRTIVEMAFFDAYSHTEIAEKLGKPLGTVKSRVRQALGRLRDLLSGEQP